MLLEFWYVEGLRIFDVSIRNSPFWNLHPYWSRDIWIHHINITADSPANAHYNTDGIDPDSCEDVLIEDYYYCAGDDAIAIKSGWNVAGILYGRPSRNITVRRSTSGCRGGWTIGSEASAGVEDVLFEDLVSTGESGIRISGELDRGGFVRNVTFRNLTFSWSTLQKKTFLFSVQQNYPNGGIASPCRFPNGTLCPIPPLTPEQTTPDFRGIRFENVTVLHAPRGLNIGNFDCTVAPCLGIEMAHIKLLDAPGVNGMTCRGVSGSQADVDDRAFSPTCIFTNNSREITFV
jgi:hypothetical protein